MTRLTLRLQKIYFTISNTNTQHTRACNIYNTSSSLSRLQPNNIFSHSQKSLSLFSFLISILSPYLMLSPFLSHIFSQLRSPSTHVDIFSTVSLSLSLCTLFISLSLSLSLSLTPPFSLKSPTQDDYETQMEVWS